MPIDIYRQKTRAVRACSNDVLIITYVENSLYRLLGFILSFASDLPYGSGGRVSFW